MNRHHLQYARRALAFACLLFAASAHATDLDCDPAALETGKIQAHRLICESALFSMGYQRIYADQQRRLRNGAISEADVAAFRQQRDACGSAACLDAVFRAWNANARQARGAGRP